MPSTTSNNLNTSVKWNGSNETHDRYKAWVNDVSLWANQNQMAWIMKIAKRLEEAPNFRRPVPEPHLCASSSSTKRRPLATNSSMRFKDLQKLTQVKILPKTDRQTT